MNDELKNQTLKQQVEGQCTRIDILKNETKINIIIQGVVDLEGAVEEKYRKKYEKCLRKWRNGGRTHY